MASAVARLTDRVSTVLGLNPGPFTLQGTNTYVVGTGSSRILIDTGEGRADYLANLLEHLRETGCSELAYILLTHHHYDHVGGVRDILKHFPGAKVHKRHTQALAAPALCPHEAAATSASADEQTKQAALRVHALQQQQQNPEQREQQRQQPHPEVVESSGSGDRHECGSHHDSADPLLKGIEVHDIEDGQVFEVEGARVMAQLTPGHTDDHVAFLLEEPEGTSVFAGDCVLGAGTSVFGNLQLYLRSLRRLADARPYRIYTGHGPTPIEGLAEPPKYESGQQAAVPLAAEGSAMSKAQMLLEEYIRHRGVREQQILECLKQASNSNSQNNNNADRSESDCKSDCDNQKVDACDGSENKDAKDDATGGLTSMQIVAQIYQGYPESVWPAAEHSVLHHLRKLLFDGRIGCDIRPSLNSEMVHVWFVLPEAANA